MLEILDIHKTFDATLALRGVTFDLPRGNIGALLGPSGGGKSTLLEIIAGLQPPDRGDIRWEGRTMLPVPPHQRGFGMVFQDYALFPHMDVFENIAFGLRMMRLPRSEIRRRVEQLAALVGLQGFERRRVTTLSGGEQQRVALARALAPRPRLLLMDEPLGALDRALRERLLLDLKRILREVRQTALYVTHDQEEAFTLADRVILLREGKVEQIGTPQEIYRAPRSAFAARFLGFENILEGETHRSGGRWWVQTPLGRLPYPGEGRPPAGRVRLLLRPDAFRLNPAGAAAFQITGRIEEISFRGARQRLLVQTETTRLQADFSGQAALPPVGASIRLFFDPSQALHRLEA